MTRTILSFATYPTTQPRQGGQKRIAAFRAAYAKHGIDLVSASVVVRPPYTAAECAPFDYAHAALATPYAGLPHLDDLRAGLFAAEDAGALRHFLQVIAQTRPVALQLEQPFLWPLIDRLRRDPAIAALPLIYASQNWEAPLKAEILKGAGVQETDVTAVAAEIERLEQNAAGTADLIFVVSEQDAAHYVTLAKPGAITHVAPNGTSAPLPNVQPDPALAGRRYALTVGSDYPPNVEGAAALIYAPGLWFMPPEPSLAVCGAMAYGVFATDAYQDFLGAHDARTRFYPQPSDRELAGLIAHAHMIVLPVRFGGGSSLKTAEALVAGSHIVATPTALRGFERFASARGVHIGAGAEGFHAAMIEAWTAPRLSLSEADRSDRAALTWEHCLAPAVAAAVQHLRL